MLSSGQDIATAQAVLLEAVRLGVGVTASL